MPFKMHNIVFFQEKKRKKSLCLTYLKISDPLPETHLFFYLAEVVIIYTVVVLKLYYYLSTKKGKTEYFSYIYFDFVKYTLYCKKKS